MKKEIHKLDKTDILVSVACGSIGGLIDIFLVGAPGESILGNWTNEMTDTVVKKFAKQLGWKPQKGNEDNVRCAIQYLQGRFKVNYDQSNTKDVGGLFSMSSKQHHMMSLGHSPDIVGLFFSILNQFTYTSTFIVNGSLITIDTYGGETILVGRNFFSKLLCGVWNWFGHLMSDVAGSAGSVNGGTGIVIPYYEFLGFCKFGKFKIANGTKTLSELALQAFSADSGYDFRFGMAMAIPVMITDMSIRFLWAIRRHFDYGYDVKDCIPTSAHEDLRLMLIIGDGTLCVLDAADAAIRSGGDALKFFMRLNLIAWFKLVKMVLREISIRLMMGDEYLFELVAEINCAIDRNLEELRQLDIEAYERQLIELNDFNFSLQSIDNDKELADLLYKHAKKNGIELQVRNHDDFDKFMLDDNTVINLE